MKEKRIRMYLIFWFEKKAHEKYKNLSTFGVSKSGDEFICLAEVDQISKRYIDFDEVLKKFLENCKRDQKIIKSLIDEMDGRFNIEIVPEISSYSSPPSITLNRKLIELINFLGDKFSYIEIDTYLI